MERRATDDARRARPRPKRARLRRAPPPRRARRRSPQPAARKASVSTAHSLRASVHASDASGGGVPHSGPPTFQSSSGILCGRYREFRDLSMNPTTDLLSRASASAAAGREKGPSRLAVSRTIDEVKASGSVLDGQVLGRLDRWRKARAVFVRPDGPEAERAVAAVYGRSWVRAPMYGRARRLLVERTPEAFLDDLANALGPLAERVRVAPEDMRQTKWDAMSRLQSLSRARREVQALWLADELTTGEFFVEFQPLFDLKTGDPVGYEGLLRAQGRDGQPKLAAEIFPAAESLQLERSFERFSWTCVLEAASRIPEGALLFLNVNPRLIERSEHALAALGEESERRGLPFSRLVLDLVEIEKLPGGRGPRDGPHGAAGPRRGHRARRHHLRLRHAAVLPRPAARVDQGRQRGDQGHRPGPAPPRDPEVPGGPGEGVLVDAHRRGDRVGRGPGHLRGGGRRRRAGLLPRAARRPAAARRRRSSGSGSKRGRRRSARPERPGRSAISAVRLDVWLDVSCVFPTRSRAKAACEGGKVDVNGARAKPHREIRVGDRVSVSGREGSRRELIVRGLAERSIPKRAGPQALRGRDAAAEPRGRRGAPAGPPALAARRPRPPGRNERRERIRFKRERDR